MDLRPAYGAGREDTLEYVRLAEAERLGCVSTALTMSDDAWPGKGIVQPRDATIVVGT